MSRTRYARQRGDGWQRPRVTGAMRRRAYYYTLFAGGRSVNTITWWRPVGVKR